MDTGSVNRLRNESWGSIKFRKLFHPVIPSNYHDPLGLTWRLLTKGSQVGRMTMFYSALGAICTPLDLFMRSFERKLYKDALPPKKPMIFVCGAPRSGTTIMAQALMSSLPVFYLNNVTSIFPRSPIMALLLADKIFKKGEVEVELNSFYGRTKGLFMPNDALYLWDRWTGSDRKEIPELFLADQQADIIQFFGALEAFSGRPLVNKNNALNTYAHLIAPLFEHSYFICMERDPLYLAQSHLIARKFIHGNEAISYGTPEPFRIVDKWNKHETSAKDPILDICNQITFHDRINVRQEEKLGKNRFIIVPYESFCAQPIHWVQRLAQRILGISLHESRLEKKLLNITSQNKQKVDNETFAKIQESLYSLKSKRSA